LVNGLPDTITNSDGVPDNINEWLKYFPQAKPQAQGRDVNIGLIQIQQAIA